MSVVPPPTSINTTPNSRSSSVSTASATANGANTISATLRPLRLQHLMTFCTEATAPVTMCTFASRRTPDMPKGIPDAVLIIDDVILRQNVEHLAIHRDRHRLGGIDHPLQVALPSPLCFSPRRCRGY